MSVEPAPSALPQEALAYVSAVDATPSSTPEAKKSTKGWWQKFVSVVWDPDYYEKSDAERKLVSKIDCGILTCVAFGYLMKYIDQTNLNNAYVSGMKTDLKFKGNEYTYLTVMYNAVYCIMQVPANLLVLKVRPSYVLAGCELGWMCFTFAQAGAQTVNQLYAFRFFIALFEAPFQPASILLMGSWYNKNELGKRVAIWMISGTAGQAFSGFMQAAIYKTLEGAGGLPGWRWLYIICGLMTLPCGLAILFFLPDYPSNTKVWYLTEEEKEMAKARCALAGTKPATGIINRQTFLRFAKGWHFWVLLPTYVVYAWGVQSYNYFNTYLLLSGYSVSNRNVLPSLAYVIGIPVQFLWGFLSDRFQSRFAFTFGPVLWGLVPTGILCFYAPSKSVRLFAFMVAETYFVTPVYFTWVNELCRGDAEERAFMIGAANCLFYAVNAWLPTLVFLQTQGPRWKKGFPTLFAGCILSCFAFVLIRYLERRDRNKASIMEEEPEVRAQAEETLAASEGDEKEYKI
ncbi:pantothenate transporter liz1 [Naematelia encephala]|uniref:Pantothenate transporter liz1 n=1 Tax=Naematelia encephala TaxID=71784 RepID=A0A1Y2BFN3_9TREE|nr:pantothenate transporter liz1 [Naematelia encephala]